MKLRLNSRRGKRGSVLVIVLVLMLVAVVVYICIKLWEASQIPPRTLPDGMAQQRLATFNRFAESAPIFVATNTSPATNVVWVLQTCTDLSKANWTDWPDGLDFNFYTNDYGFFRLKAVQFSR